MPEFAAEIKTKIQGEIDVSKETLVKYSHDASIFEVLPQMVIHPKSVADVKALVKFVAQNKHKDPTLSLTARSGGTDMSGGPLNQSIILDFTTHFQRLGPIVTLSGDQSRTYGEDIAGLAEVEPGVFYRDFERETLKANLLMPTYPASRLICTVGGMVSNNSDGEHSLTYGQTKDFIEELRVVLSDGEEYTFKALNESELENKLKLTGFEGQLYRNIFRLIKENYDLIQKSKPQTSKNSAGYFLWDVWDKQKFNLAKLIAGSQGTLGLVTNIKFRLVRPKTSSELLVIFLKDLQPLGELIKTVLAHKPETFESYDNHTFKLAVKFLPGLIKKMKGGFFGLALSFLPELFLTAVGGIPKLVLIAEFSGENEDEILLKIKNLQDEIHHKFGLKSHITKSPREAQKYWTIRRESFNLLRQHSSGLATAPFIDDIIVKPEQLPEFLPQLNRILTKYPFLVYTIAGHMGDANFHIIPLMDLKDASQRLIIPRLADEVYNLVLNFKGSITAEHNDGIIRTPYLEKMFGPAMAGLFGQVKQIFDPQNIFNPGKKVGGTLTYAFSHIKKG